MHAWSQLVGLGCTRYPAFERAARHESGGWRRRRRRAIHRCRSLAPAGAGRRPACVGPAAGVLPQSPGGHSPIRAGHVAPRPELRRLTRCRRRSRLGRDRISGVLSRTGQFYRTLNMSGQCGRSLAIHRERPVGARPADGRRARSTLVDAGETLCGDAPVVRVVSIRWKSTERQGSSDRTSGAGNLPSEKRRNKANLNRPLVARWQRVNIDTFGSADTEQTQFPRLGPGRSMTGNAGGWNPRGLAGSRETRGAWLGERELSPDPAPGRKRVRAGRTAALAAVRSHESILE